MSQQDYFTSQLLTTSGLGIYLHMVSSSKKEGGSPMDTDTVQIVPGRLSQAEKRRQSSGNDAEDAARAHRASGSDEHAPEAAKRKTKKSKKSSKKARKVSQDAGGAR